jgi:hypothetical protein
MTQLIDLGKLRFHFAGDWVSGTTYESNDIVKYGGNVYVYTYALKSAGTLPTDSSRWALMIEGFKFQGEFDVAVNYKVGDTVAHGGVVYVAVLDSVNTTPPNATYWSKFLDGIQYEGIYSDVGVYQKSDVVNYGGSIYIAKQDTSGNLPTNATFWDKFVEGVSPQGVYNDATAYVPNDLVAYGANIYRNKIESTGNVPSNETYWELYIGGIKFQGTFSAVTEYFVNDLVVYGNSIYRSRQTQSAILPTVVANWELLTGGVNYAGNWDVATQYYIGDIVVYGNNSYRATVTTLGTNPTDLVDWVLQAGATDYKGIYSNATTYYIGDLVNYGGNVYLNTAESTGEVPTNASFWSIYSAGFSYLGVWSTGTEYFIGQVISYGGSLYQAKSTNTAVNPTTTATWDKIVPGIKSTGPWATLTEYATDEVVTYGGNTYIVLLPHAAGADFNVDLAAGKWQKFNSGIRWRGIWSSATQYFKDDVVKAGSSSYIANQDIIGGNSPASAVLPEWDNFATGAEGFLSKDGDSMLGMLTLYADPTDALHAATKQYVDGFVNAASGGTILGPLVASGAAASYSATGGSTINIDAGELNLTGGTTLSIDGTSSIGEVTVAGDINLNGGNLDTTQTSINLVNTNATTVNIAGAGTLVDIGAATGTTSINNDLDVDGNINVDGGTVSSNTTSLDLFNTNVTTANVLGDGTAISIGAATGTTTVNNNLVVTGTTTFNGGTISLGDSDGDNVVFGADVNSNVIPNIDDTYDLGTVTKQWKDIYIDGTASIDTLTVDENAGVTGTLTVTDKTYLVGELDSGIGGTTYTNTSLDPTGFDNSHATTRGIIEFSDNGTRVYSIGTNGVVTEREDSTFATGTAYSVTATSNTLVMYPAAGQANFTYYVNGVRYEKTALESVTLAGTPTLYHYFHFADGVLSSSTTRNDASLISNAQVASIYISPSNNRITYISDERHGISIDGDSLVYANKDGLKVISGFGLTGTAGLENYVSTSLGELRNADLRIDVPVKTSNKFASRLATDWKISDFGNTLVSNKLSILGSATVTNGGSGYRGATTIAVVQGDGSGATVELGFTSAPIASVTLLDGGYDYNPGTTIDITGDGTGATASIDIPAGFNLNTYANGGLTLTNPGDGYTNPVITVVNDAGDPTGEGAVISHTLDLGTPVAHVHMDTLGSGYTTATATITGDGAGATATVTIVAGAVTDINLTSGGTGYTTATVTITGDGTGATATVYTLKNEIVDYVITNVGSGYTAATVTINGDGHGATATATVTAGGVTDIAITNAGHSYTYATMTITGDGTSATAEPRLSGYPISTISFANDDARGKNYQVNPTVTIVEDGFGIVLDNGTLGGGTPVQSAITTALSTGNTINGIALTNPGTGYTTATLTFNGAGDGTGATTNISTEPSSILSCTVTNGGKQYTYADIIITSPTGSGATFTTSLTPVPQFNEKIAGQYDFANIPTNKFTTTYFVAISGVDNVIKIPSEYTFDSIVEAYMKATAEIEELKTYGLPFEKYEFIGFSIINHLGEIQTMSDTNQGNVVYYDLTARIATDLVEGQVGDAGVAGRSLTVKSSGVNAAWLGATESNKVYYVAPHGVDALHSGRNQSTPFASIKYACAQAGANATIFVKTGSYTEELPIVVGDNTAVVGDNQRTTLVHAAAGFETGTMWKLSNGAILNKMTFKGMTGWVPGATAEDITTSTPAGIAVAFNELSPITTKSPYVLECSFIGSGGIGVYVDGSVHATGNKSMIFHGYTIISDNGVGYWIDNGGLAELVSNFTYFCYFGYTCTDGSQIRSLNGNCSYGTYGASSSGFDANETPLTGALVGQQIKAVYISGTVNIGDTITDTVTGATATILNVQYSADKVYVENIVGDFGEGNNLTTTSGGLFTSDLGADSNVDGFILIVNGLSAEPRPGGSVSLSDDSISYVIQSVSGTYVDNTSNMVIVLAQEKPTTSAPGAVITIRYNYSQVRLTGHDFLSIGTGGTVTTNHPGEPTQPPAQGNEIQETFPGRVYYVSTDQNGNFRVGEYFKIDQATGTATLNANAFNLAGLTSLRLGSIGAQLGESINEFSSDVTLAGNSNIAVPTEAAVKRYVDSYTVPTNFNSSTDITEDASGFITTALISGTGTTYSNVVYETVGDATASYKRITSYNQTIRGVTHSITLTYNANGSINTITAVLS